MAFRPGLLIGSLVLAACGALFLSFEAHWFSILLLLFGILGALLSFDYGPPLPVAGQPPAPPMPLASAPPAPDLRQQLFELDQMLADEVLSPVEHRRKRKALIDAWGGPDAE